MQLHPPIARSERDRATLTKALQFAAIFALLKLALQVGATIYTTHIGYGYFRDEFYYIICGRFLDWGYVDHSPMVALQSRLAILLFGKSLVGIRMLSALAGAVRVFLTGLIAWSLGGRRAAQFLAMLAVIVALCYIGGDGYLSMNSFESIFWMGCILTLIWIARGASPKWWLLIGILAGLGLENKALDDFLPCRSRPRVDQQKFTPQRRLLWNRWCAGAIRADDSSRPAEPALADKPSLANSSSSSTTAALKTRTSKSAPASSFSSRSLPSIRSMSSYGARAWSGSSSRQAPKAFAGSAQPISSSSR